MILLVKEIESGRISQAEACWV